MTRVVWNNGILDDRESHHHDAEERAADHHPRRRSVHPIRGAHELQLAAVNGGGVARALFIVRKPHDRICDVDCHGWRQDDNHGHEFRARYRESAVGGDSKHHHGRVPHGNELRYYVSHDD